MDQLLKSSIENKIFSPPLCDYLQNTKKHLHLWKGLQIRFYATIEKCRNAEKHVKNIESINKCLSAGINEFVYKDGHK